MTSCAKKNAKSMNEAAKPVAREKADNKKKAALKVVKKTAEKSSGKKKEGKEKGSTAKAWSFPVGPRPL